MGQMTAQEIADSVTKYGNELLVFSLSQNMLIKGLSAGAVKG